MTAELKQEIQQMKNIGQSYMQIASTLCISENTIKSYCRRNNICTVESNRSEVIKESHNFCKHCETPLKHGSKGQPKKFCSDKCRRVWWKSNNNQLVKKAYYTLTCVRCGKKFESYGNQNRKFCCHACYIDYRYNNIENRFEKVGDGHDE